MWLLDDDNIPHKDALKNLLYHVDRNFSTGEKVLFSNRIDRKKYVNAFKDPSGFYVKKDNTFLGFSFIQKLKTVTKLYHKNPSDIKNIVDVQYATYGGMLISVNTIKKYGFINESLYLYQDDKYYTYNLFLSGVSLKIIKNSNFHIKLLIILETSINIIWYSITSTIKNK